MRERTRPKEQYVRGAVRNAILPGKLIKPDKCERCGISSRPGSDGRSTLHGHHHDYDRPLDVEWLCAKCHKEDTPYGSAILTEKQAAYIRLSPLTGKELARKFGVHKSTISNIRTSKTWRNAQLKKELDDAL
jgi:hypothetical protein